MSAADLAIAGFVPFSALDWPGKLSAVAFLQGCPWNCGYCQNPDLLDMKAPGDIPWGDIVTTLKQRRGLLDGVVFSGGEPTRQRALVDAVLDLQGLGFGAALHTSGAYPDRLEALLPHVAWVGLDIKAPQPRYAEVTRRADSGEKAWASLDLVIASGVDYEVRVTVDPTIMTLEDVEEIIAEVARRGGRPPVLQETRAEGAREKYVERLGKLRLTDVVPAEALPGIERRVELPSEASPGIREAVSRREATEV